MSTWENRSSQYDDVTDQGEGGVGGKEMKKEKKKNFLGMISSGESRSAMTTAESKKR